MQRRKAAIPQGYVVLQYHPTWAESVASLKESFGDGACCLLHAQCGEVELPSDPQLSGGLLAEKATMKSSRVSAGRFRHPLKNWV